LIQHNLWLVCQGGCTSIPDTFAQLFPLRGNNSSVRGYGPEQMYPTHLHHRSLVGVAIVLFFNAGHRLNGGQLTVVVTSLFLHVI
jgi:hypothetical protein